MSKEDLDFIGPEVCPYCGQVASVVEEEGETTMIRGPYKGKTVTTVHRFYRCDNGCTYEVENLIEPMAWVDPEMYQRNFETLMEELKKKYG